jgi:hypothetical protein
MKTTVTFYINEDLQKKLIAENKNAERKQKIEIDLTNAQLIEIANVDEKGNAKIEIESYYYHYDNDGDWRSHSQKFSEIPDQEKLINFFENEKEKEENDKHIENAKKAEQDIAKQKQKEENEKEKKEIEKLAALKKIEDEKQQIEIDKFVNCFGSEKLKLRKELGYEYNDLSINEMLDEIECKFEKINYDEIKTWDGISHPSIELMQAEKKLMQNKNVVKVQVILIEKKIDYDYEEEPENFEGFKISYEILGVQKTRYYIA